MSTSCVANERGQILDHVKNDDGTIAHGHIVITEPGTFKSVNNPVLPNVRRPPAEAKAITVLESTGGHGLVDSPYYFLDVNRRGVFTVYRGVRREDCSSGADAYTLRRDSRVNPEETRDALTAFYDALDRRDGEPSRALRPTRLRDRYFGSSEPTWTNVDSLLRRAGFRSPTRSPRPARAGARSSGGPLSLAGRRPVVNVILSRSIRGDRIVRQRDASIPSLAAQRSDYRGGSSGVSNGSAGSAIARPREDRPAGRGEQEIPAGSGAAPLRPRAHIRKGTRPRDARRHSESRRTPRSRRRRSPSPGGPARRERWREGPR